MSKTNDPLKIPKDGHWITFNCSNCYKHFGAYYDIMHIGSRNAIIICESCANKLNKAKQ